MQHKVCGSVWFRTPTPLQVRYIDQYGNDLIVLACSCGKDDNCQAH